MSSIEPAWYKSVVDSTYDLRIRNNDLFSGFNPYDTSGFPLFAFRIITLLDDSGLERPQVQVIFRNASSALSSVKVLPYSECHSTANR